MDTYSWALVAAGCIGSFIAVFHGIVTQKTMIKPILEQTDFPESTARLVPLLLHFSTLCWFFGGAALIATPFIRDTSTVLTVAAFVGVFYTVGAVGNFWGTRGRHPGWVLLAISAALIAYASVGIIE
jgi:hypothetical protein